MPVRKYSYQFTDGEGFDPLHLHRYKPDRYPFLLESVVHGTDQSRYDIIFAFPGQELCCHLDDKVAAPAFLTELDELWKQERQGKSAQSSLPFNGGWFLYLGYELAGVIESSLQLDPAPSTLPTAFAVRIPAAVIRDHKTNEIFLVCEPGCESLLDPIERDLVAVRGRSASQLPVSTSISGQLIEDEPELYTAGVKKIKQYILDGDVFQVNLSRQWSLLLNESVDSANLYDQLRQHNPAPFAALVNYRGNSIISSSPERLFDIRAGKISTRPIAGTRPRGDDDESDKQFSETLMAHPKDRAEHVMLIDLERNDLGRVCKPGTIKVDELMVLESYAHVHHIVSNVSGQLADDISPGEAIAATFPGGTITGCPKVRCMEIIKELETATRGPYTGSLGYLGHSGEMDLNILIRTLLLEGKALSFRTGAGIVADSDPESELHETRVKAKGLLRALGMHDDDFS